jgi:membrane dipeptidase
VTGKEKTQLVFDGHNDVLGKIRKRPGAGKWFLSDAAGAGSSKRRKGDIDLARCLEGGFGGGMFAIYVPGEGVDFDRMLIATEEGWEIPPIAPVDGERAWVTAIAMAADLHRLARQSGGRFAVVRDADALEAAFADGIVAAVMHMEGAEGLDAPDGFEDRLELLYAAGLRSLGLVWSRPNGFAEGVPFGFPRSPDTGPGLTKVGRKLVKTCNQLGIVVDLSHLNLRGFREVAKLSEAPLVASHSAAHAIAATSRNLLDEQIDAIGETSGIVGINFNVSDLRGDGRDDPTVPLSAIADHAAYVAERIGVEHVGLGSDMDGATMPRELGDVGGMQRVIAALREHGFSEQEVEMIARGNWLRVLRTTWRP